MSDDLAEPCPLTLDLSTMTADERRRLRASAPSPVTATELAAAAGLGGSFEAYKRLRALELRQHADTLERMLPFRISACVRSGGSLESDPVFLALSAASALMRVEAQRLERAALGGEVGVDE